MRTTPFYQLVLDLVGIPNSLQLPEQRLLEGFLKSIPKMAKQTPIEYLSEASKLPPPQFPSDLTPYQNAHNENMPKTNLLTKASTVPIISDSAANEEQKLGYLLTASNQLILDEDELNLNEYLPGILRPIPFANENYLLEDVNFIYK